MCKDPFLTSTLISTPGTASRSVPRAAATSRAVPAVVS
jgi:hypothetical protein